MAFKKGDILKPVTDNTGLLPVDFVFHEYDFDGDCLVSRAVTGMSRLAVRPGAMWYADGRHPLTEATR